jgi:hypothetical protein
LILLGVGGQSTAEDVIWFDDVELYRMTGIKAGADRGSRAGSLERE